MRMSEPNLLISLSSKYSNIIFTCSQVSSQTLEDINSTLLAEERRTTKGEMVGVS